MRKKPARPLIASLCLAFLLLATPPACAEHTGRPALATITSDFGPPAHPIARAPVHPGSRAPRPSERRTLTCNRPATDLPSPPNNCTEYEPVAPPDEPIPPPCIASARYQETEEYGEPLIQLQIKVDHPELCDNCRGTIELERYGYGLGNWSLSDISAEASCAKDEGPLAWATLEILNTCRLDAVAVSPPETRTPPAIYTAPLPADFLQVLAEAGDCDFDNTTSSFHSPSSIFQRTPSSTETP